MEEINYFKKLYQVDVSKWVEKKNGLSYVSWANAWAEVKKAFPNATYTIYENKDGWNYHTDGKTCWVKTGVTVDGIEHIEYLPVMDFRNKSIPVDQVTSFDVNKAIQRSLTKAVARHGLGLYIYAGEDLPEEDGEAPAKEEKPKKETKKAESKKDSKLICESCGKEITAVPDKTGEHMIPADKLADLSMKMFNKALCADCMKKEQQKGK